MSLRDIAQADVRAILGDSEKGAGLPVTVTDPKFNSGDVIGWQSDIAAQIDPDTGQAVSGRVVTIALHIKDLEAVGLGYPRGINDQSSNPWRVSYTDEFGVTYEFKVIESEPDRTLGYTICTLELYKP